MSHPSVTTYRIQGPANGNFDGPSQDSRGRSPPDCSYQRQTTKLSRTFPNDQSVISHIKNISRNPIVRTQQQPSRGRADSNDQPPPNRSSLDNFRQTAYPSRTNDRALPPVPSTGLWSVLGHLSQPADDQTIISLVQQVFLLVDNFVDNHYRDLPGQTIGENPHFSETTFPYLDGGCSPANVFFIIADSTVAIRHCLTYILLSCISFDNSDNAFSSLLPREFTTIESALRRSPPQNAEHFAALSAHRVLLSYLRADVYHDPEYQRCLDKAMEKIGRAIDETFLPWRDPHSADDIWRLTLTALMEKTAQLGILLFSQPSSFRFVWLPKSSIAGDLIVEVHPRLLKINDEQARELDPNQLMLGTKAHRTYYVQDADIQNILLTANGSNAIVTNSGDLRRHQQPRESDYSRHNTVTYQPPQAGYEAPPTSTHIDPNAIELPGDSAPQLAELSATGELLSQSLEEFVTPDLKTGSENQADGFCIEGRADVHHNGTPRTSMKNGSTRDAYSQQMNQRQKTTSFPPTASIQQFDASPLLERRRSRSSKHRRSSSASDEARGRGETSSVQTQRRASISNDRASMEHVHRIARDQELLQPSVFETGPSSQLTPHSIAGHALPATENTAIANTSAADSGRRTTSDQRSTKNQTPQMPSFTSVKLTDRNLRDGKKAGIRKLFSRSKNGR